MCLLFVYTPLNANPCLTQEKYALSQNFENRLLDSSCLSAYLPARPPVCLSVRPSVRPHCTNFHEIWHFSIFQKCAKEFSFYHNLSRLRGTLHENPCTFCTISRSVLLTMGHILDSSVEKIKTHFLCSKLYPENRAFCEIMWQNMVEPDRPQKTM